MDRPGWGWGAEEDLCGLAGLSWLLVAGWRGPLLAARLIDRGGIEEREILTQIYEDWGGILEDFL